MSDRVIAQSSHRFPVLPRGKFGVTQLETSNQAGWRGLRRLRHSQVLRHSLQTSLFQRTRGGETGSPMTAPSAKQLNVPSRPVFHSSIRFQLRQRPDTVHRASGRRASPTRQGRSWAGSAVRDRSDDACRLCGAAACHCDRAWCLGGYVKRWLAFFPRGVCEMAPCWTNWPQKSIALRDLSPRE